MATKHIFVILALLTLALLPAPAHAGGVVAVCDEAHLLAALAGGGTVTFACSGVIMLTNTITIAADTTIDGSAQDVTISGNNAVRVFTLNSEVRFNLNALTIANGAVGDYEAGGGISMRNGTLIVSNSTFAGNSAYEGGGIYKAGGAATLTNCTFTGNYATPHGPGASRGGGILNDDGALDVSDCVFSDNSAYGIGGAIDNQGTLTVSRSTFSLNHASSSRSSGGGGIVNWPRGMATVSNSTFSGNSAGGGSSAAGGAINNYGTLAASNSTFSGNRASGDFDATGGSIKNEGMLTVSNSTFSGDSASADFYVAGGSIFNRGTLTVSNSTFSGNSASGNETETSVGGGISNFDGTLTVSNSTFSGNSATDGGSISGQATLKNSIVANSTTGRNCSGAIIDGGGNLSYPDASCPGINADPLLGPLQDNGGPTWTMALGPGSAALDTGDDAICAADPVNNLDQRGVIRPQGAHCDIGALEQLRTWLPIILVP
jgi:predicted outer membrane repeat protein